MTLIASGMKLIRESLRLLLVLQPVGTNGIVKDSSWIKVDDESISQTTYFGLKPA